MTIAQEEIFGPVLTIIPYGDEDEAVRIANDSVYGLSGTVWGPDPEHAASIARRVRTGNIGVNLFMLDFAAPFGGMKESGVGREYGPEGIAAFTEIQSIHRDKPAAQRLEPELLEQLARRAGGRRPDARQRVLARLVLADHAVGVAEQRGDVHHQAPGGLAVGVGLEHLAAQLLRQLEIARLERELGGVEPRVEGALGQVRAALVDPGRARPLEVLALLGRAQRVERRGDAVAALEPRGLDQP